jgi:hypothetical protein
MIDTDKYEEIMKHDWLFEEQLIVGGGKWRFALTEYTDLIDMSERDIEEWEEGLEPIWEALVTHHFSLRKSSGCVRESSGCVRKSSNCVKR